jgi:hypothetical protein
MVFGQTEYSFSAHKFCAQNNFNSVIRFKIHCSTTLHISYGSIKSMHIGLFRKYQCRMWWTPI